MLRFVFPIFLSILLIPVPVRSQIKSFPYVEHFDSVPDSSLPQGWETSRNRRAAGDFFASLSTPRSAPHCLYSQNSLIAQSLTTVIFDFSNRTPDKLQFYSARSSTHKSALLIEASLDGGTSFTIPLSDTLRNRGTSSYVLTTIVLPSSLSNQSNVRIRWRVVGDSGGSTGSLRVDDVALTTIISYDLEAASLAVSPQLPTSCDSLILTARLKNLGVQTSTNYKVDFFCDLNNNSIPEVGERFSSLGVPAISKADSALVSAGHAKLKAGDYQFYAIVSSPLDEQHSNDTASTTITIGYTRRSVLVNEFVYAPSGDEPEWVELSNCSTDTVNMKNWRISDFNITSKSVITSTDVFVPPQGFCIVTKDAGFTSYHPSVTCPVVISTFSALNNTTPDAVVLYDPRLITMDSVFYSPSWGGQSGKSLERVDLTQPSVDVRNWGTSQDSDGFTPGRANSIVRLDFDLSSGTCYLTRIEKGSGLIPVVHCVVHNVGRNPANTYSASIFNDANRDSVCDSDEMIDILHSTSPLNPGDSVICSYEWLTPPQGETIVFIIIDFPLDQRSSNNRSSTLLETHYTPRSVVVNEIMYEPLENQNEWIELYNRGNDMVDVKNWTITDRPTASGNTNSIAVSQRSVLLRPRGYCVIAADSSIFTLFPYLSNPTSDFDVITLHEPGGLSLGNEGDDIVLRDLTGTTIDSVSYSPRWHRPDVTDIKGRSLERINPDLDSNLPSNWTTSVLKQGGTPGRSNCALTSGRQTTSSLTFSPNPFSPDGDGFEDFCLVQYRLPLATALIHVMIFDIKGRLIRILANSLISASHGELVWDGLDQNRQRARIGPYVVLIQAVNPNGSGATTLKGVVVVAARL